MAYFEVPNSISYSYDNKDIESECLNWHNIKYNIHSLNTPITHFDVNYYSCEYSTLARVCRELGNRLGAYYGLYGTGAYPYDIKTILPSLTSELTSSEVQYRNPGPDDFGEGIIIISGTEASSNVGHTWILDGFKEWTLHYYTYLLTTNGIISKKSNEMEYDKTITYLHYNWGWDGTCNGYFLKNVFDSSRSVELDGGVSSKNNGKFSSNVFFFEISK